MTNGKTIALHNFLVGHAEVIAEEWHMQQQAKPGSHYSLEASPEIQKNIKEQNTHYLVIITDSLLHTQVETKSKLDEWTAITSRDRINSTTSIDEVVRSNRIFRRVIWDYVRRFIEECEDTDPISAKDFLYWEKELNETLDYTLERFTYLFMNLLLDRLASQASLIKDLSAPVIGINSDIGLLPIIGEIDTERARGMLESTLKQSVDSGINLLILDLSGVVMVDTMVAQEIFQLIESLRLVGVKTILTGIRPEVAQISIQLGLDFGGIHTESSLKNVFSKLSSQKRFN